MASRLVSTKYQLNVEIVRTRMRLKKATNFVRRLTNRWPDGAGAKDAGTSRGACDVAVSISELVSFINKTIKFFRECNAKEPRGLKIHRDLHPFDRYGFERQDPLSINNAFGQ